MGLRFLTAGESHGKGLVGIVEGTPSGLEIDGDYLNQQLKRRKLGYGRGARQKIETDAAEFMSGVRHGKTLGGPIALLLPNRDWKNWTEIMGVDPPEGPVKRQVEIPRPGHADYVGRIKYNHQDMRNVLERSSARETAMRVGVAVIARKLLQTVGIHVASRVTEIGNARDCSPLDIPIPELNGRVDESPVRCTNPSTEAEMVALIEQHKKDGDTLGGIFEVFASGVPIGLGSFAQWDRRLEGKIGHHFLSLNAIKGVEIGIGFEAGRIAGSQVHDQYLPGKEPGKVDYQTNRSGGIDGGMTTGQPIIVRAAMKPISTLMKPLKSVDLQTNQPTHAHVERSDVCAVPSAAVIGESLLALILADAILEKFGGDSVEELAGRVKQWNEQTR